MNISTAAGLDKCLTFINCHLQPPFGPITFTEDTTVKRAVTISRQSGCGAHTLAEKLAACLQSRSPGAAPWTVFDRNLVDQVLAEHHLPERMARFLPEDRISRIEDAVEEIFGLHPPSSALIEQIAETVLRLAELGNAIILGRGANVITARLPHVVHVRVVAAEESRIQHMIDFERLSPRAARERVRREDLGRKRYLRNHFDREVDDPLLYHLIINTDLVSLDDAARLIGDFVLHRRSTAATALR